METNATMTAVWFSAQSGREKLMCFSSCGEQSEVRTIMAITQFCTREPNVRSHTAFIVYSEEKNMHARHKGHRCPHKREKNDKADSR